MSARLGAYANIHVLHYTIYLIFQVIREVQQYSMRHACILTAQQYIIIHQPN